jgi:hypothetical protein
MITKFIGKHKVVKAFDLRDHSECYKGPVLIDDLQKELGTEGHVFVIRGDKAYEPQVGQRANPKFWLYENLLNSERIKRWLKHRPDFALFDGTGESSLKALNYFAGVLGRRAVIVTSKEIYERINPSDFPNVELISPEGSAEQGYVEKQEEIIRDRKGLILLTQALYGARSLAPIGNNVASQLEEMAITPDESFWVCASGSNLYGLGGMIKRKFPNCKVNLVEPESKRTIDPELDLRNKDEVRAFARKELGDYSVDEKEVVVDPKDLPLHLKHANRYLLKNWEITGNTGIDSLRGVSDFERDNTERLILASNPNYFWTGTTYSALTPAIESARKGKNVIVMAYGKGQRE